MKRLFIFLTVAILMVLALTACASSTPEVSEPEAPAGETRGEPLHVRLRRFARHKALPHHIQQVVTGQPENEEKKHKNNETTASARSFHLSSECMNIVIITGKGVLRSNVL